MRTKTPAKKAKPIIFPGQSAYPGIYAVLTQTKHKPMFCWPIPGNPAFAALTQAGVITSPHPILSGKESPSGLVEAKCGSVTTWDQLRYQPGDILFLREPWHIVAVNEKTLEVYFGYEMPGPGKTVSFKDPQEEDEGRFNYLAFLQQWRVGKTYSCVVMPRIAARTYLRIADITELSCKKKHMLDGEDMAKLGFPEASGKLGLVAEVRAKRMFNEWWDERYGKARPIRVAPQKGEPPHYEVYSPLALNRSRGGVTCISNPWLLLYACEHITEAEAMAELNKEKGI